MHLLYNIAVGQTFRSVRWAAMDNPEGLSLQRGVRRQARGVRRDFRMNKKKVVVGLSGGIDSSVAALLLVEQGYEVIGATLRIWEEGEYLDGEWHDGSCCKTGLARFAAEQLKIPYYT